MAAAVDVCRVALERRQNLTIGVVNAAKLVKMRHDPLLRDSVLGADMVLADGMSVVWASRVLRRPLPERVAGIDLFTELLKQAERLGGSVYFLGAKQDVLARMLEQIALKHPRLKLAGSRDGYFRPEEEPAVAEAIRRSGADYLFVAMTSPMKEKFLARWGAKLDVRVCHGVGGSFDVLAGEVQRAPERWQRLGMEWLYRVVQEPRRLWRRYLVTNVMFLALLTKELVSTTPRYPVPDLGTVLHAGETPRGG
jgi:N-acetylglucosaminyldiphosphoundecaprenol N-acetyl-beta-D-mannosaminyltransferase